jgi:hypothetical protein
MFNGRIDKDPPDPAFKRSVAAIAVDLIEDLNKPFL